MVGSTAGRGKSTRKKARKPQGKPERQELDRFIPGFHAVRETLEQEKTPLREIWIAEGKRSARTEEIRRLATAKNIPFHFKQISYLSELFGDISHQGIVGVTKPFAYSDFQQVLRRSLNKGPSALLLAADHITDPSNLGALIRTAAFFDVHGLILPKDRSAGITAATLKRASGTHHQIPITQVTNLGRSLDELTKNGFWIIGAAGEADSSIYDFDWNRPVLLVLGSEQKGISPSIRKRCHQLVSIPSPGGVESLNISVAGGVILSEICRQRLAIPPSKPSFPQSRKTHHSSA